ncbi:MAG: winged helix DNA-binding domain-containing protein [Ruminococcaceae bacterium]|nr:winged helix DNA-binding domain-containing protein [Oscillospiraceae bacterium]
MTREEILLRRLRGQYLLSPGDCKTVIQDLCGVQAQFLSHALHGLTIRCQDIETSALVKSWTIRGTMHLFSPEDLPLFLHKGRTHFLRPVDTMDEDRFCTATRKAYFAEHILAAVAGGMDQRESLKIYCQEKGITETESRSLFDPWGGLIRALCEEGKLCHKAQEKKAYRLCPSFTPMEEEPARLEMARRYFTHFGPATIRDAAYFFGCTQKRVKFWLRQLPVQETVLDGRAYYNLDLGSAPAGNLPECLFLAGFDQLLLGYEKTESLILPREYLREIFTLSGIVRPALLIRGQVAGWWKKQGKTLQVKLLSSAERHLVESSAPALWPDLGKVQYV